MGVMGQESRAGEQGREAENLVLLVVLVLLPLMLGIADGRSRGIAGHCGAKYTIAGMRPKVTVKIESAS